MMIEIAVNTYLMGKDGAVCVPTVTLLAEHQDGDGTGPSMAGGSESSGDAAIERLVAALQMKIATDPVLQALRPMEPEEVKEYRKWEMSKDDSSSRIRVN